MRVHVRSVYESRTYLSPSAGHSDKVMAAPRSGSFFPQAEASTSGLGARVGALR